MKQLREVMSVIKSETGLPVYSDNVPESEKSTAIAVINLGSTRPRTLLSGQVAGRSFTWRATVVSKDAVELESTIEKLELLDNKSYTGFQRLFVDQVILEPKEFSEPFRRAFITITTYV